jgi:transposase
MRFDVKSKLNSIPKEALIFMNKSEVARRLDCDPRTIDRYLKIEAGDWQPAKRKPRGSVLDPYKDIILEKVDRHGVSAISIYHYIQSLGYQGKYSILTDFIHKHKNESHKRATIRFETSPGLQAQIDWKEDFSMENREGLTFKVNIFLAVLGYSRLKFLCLTQDRSQQTLFTCLKLALCYFGGVPKEMLFDNMKTVVDRSRSTTADVSLNETFRCFSADAGFEAVTCRPYRPQTKGKVESLARLVERLRVYQNEFDTFEDLGRIVEEFMDEINRETSQATAEIPIKRFEKEKEHLLPLPAIDILDSYIFRQKEYKVSKESMIRYQGRKYSVPTRYIGSLMKATELEGNLQIHYNGDVVACHPISEKRYHYKTEHLHEILKSDACRHMSDADVLAFMQDNLSMMDIFLGE